MATVQDIQDALAFERRKQAQRRGLLGLLMFIVIVFTALWLMLPAISATQDSLENAGVELSATTQSNETPARALATASDDDEGETESSTDQDASSADDQEAASTDDQATASTPSDKTGSSTESKKDNASSTESGKNATDADDNADADTADDPDSTSDTPEDADTTDMPAQSFTGALKNKQGKATLTVDVDAPEGAFPAGTTMKVRVVKAQDVQDAVDEAVAQKTSAKVGEIQAADITFYDADGDEVEPATTISVKFASPKIAAAEEFPLVVHVDDEGAGEVVDRLSASELQQRDQKLASDELVVDVDSFSVYVLAFTVDFGYNVDGQTYEFTLHGGGDSTSLRKLVEALHVAVDDPDTPENEIDAFMDGVKTVEFSDPKLLYVGKTEEDTTSGKIIWDNKLEVSFPLGLSQDEVLEINAAKYQKDEWVLIALKAFDTPETLTITMDDDEVFTIDVTDAQDAVEVGGQVQTVANPSGTTIDLFDYWIDNPNAVGRDGWPGFNSGWGGHDDTEGDNGYNLNGSGNNKGINSSADTEHGHALKFSPAWEGTVYNGSKVGTHQYWENGEKTYTAEEPWRSLNRNGRYGVNSYTGNGNPLQGIVANQLDENGYPVLTQNDELGTTGEGLDYLFDPGVNQAGKASYTGANQLLYVDKNGYYTYDSRDYAAAFDKDSKTFTVTKQTSNNGSIRGFWPFGTSNYWSGMHLNTQFSMPTNGTVLNPAGENMPMQFEFSGDDDTWLYVDGVLVGDGGGVHNRTEIDVNFATGKVTITGKKDSNHPGDFEETKYLDDIFKDAGKYDDSQWEDIGDGSGHKRFKAGTYHTFDMFYLERGGDESNLYIHYNLISTGDFTAHKTYKNGDESMVMARDQFQFELMALEADAIMPAYQPGGAGTVASPKYEVYNEPVTDPVTGKDVYKKLTTGVTEDGNVVFGDIEVSDQMLADGTVYHYIVREVVPDDAVNADGVTWANANETQRAAGGFVKDKIEYDGKIVYMTARAGEWQETDATGKTWTRRGLIKTRYSDPDYTTQSGGSFINFDNKYRADFGEVEFTKTDTAGEALPGATFALFEDEDCKIPARWVDQDGKPAIQAESGDDGTVKFENVRVGTYYMQEIEAPEGYVASDTIYQVTIVDKKDATAHSSIVVKGDNAAIEVTQIANPESSPEGLAVNKRWKNASGKWMTPDASATMTYDLYQVPTTMPRGNYWVDVSDLGYGKPEWSNAKKFTNDELTGDKQNLTLGSIVDVVITTTSDNWSFDTLNETDQITSNQAILSDTLANISDGKVRQRTIRIQVTNEQDEAIKLFGQLESCYEGNGGKPTITATLVETGGEPVEGDAVKVGTVALGKTTVNATLESGFSAVEVVRAAGDWTSIVKNLPDSKTEGGVVTKYSYYVVESGVADGFELLSIMPSVAHVNETITVVNKLDQTFTSLDLMKVNEDNTTQHLGGAVFKLQKDNGNGVYVAYTNEENDFFQADGTFTVPEEGLTIAGLTDGDYKLIEVSPPAGYVKTDAEYTFTIANGVVAEGDPVALVDYTAATASDPAMFQVKNKPGKPLPHTGGPGTTALYLVGILMVVVAAMILARRTITRAR